VRVEWNRVRIALTPQFIHEQNLALPFYDNLHSGLPYPLPTYRSDYSTIISLWRPEQLLHRSWRLIRKRATGCGERRCFDRTRVVGARHSECSALEQQRRRCTAALRSLRPAPRHASGIVRVLDFPRQARGVPVFSHC
jgi:hypothetical protein